MLEHLCVKLQIELYPAVSLIILLLYFSSLFFFYKTEQLRKSISKKDLDLKEAQCFITTNLRKLHVMGMNSNFKVRMKTETEKGNETQLYAIENSP